MELCGLLIGRSSSYCKHYISTLIRILFTNAWPSLAKLQCEELKFVNRDWRIAKDTKTHTRFQRLCVAGLPDCPFQWNGGTDYLLFDENEDWWVFVWLDNPPNMNWQKSLTILTLYSSTDWLMKEGTLQPHAWAQEKFKISGQNHANTLKKCHWSHQKIHLLPKTSNMSALFVS